MCLSLFSGSWADPLGDALVTQIEVLSERACVQFDQGFAIAVVHLVNLTAGLGYGTAVVEAVIAVLHFFRRNSAVDAGEVGYVIIGIGISRAAGDVSIDVVAKGAGSQSTHAAETVTGVIGVGETGLPEGLLGEIAATVVGDAALAQKPAALLRRLMLL